MDLGDLTSGKKWQKKTIPMRKYVKEKQEEKKEGEEI